MEPEPELSQFLLPLFTEPTILAIFTTDVIVSLVGIAFLLICSALVSGSEVAFFSLTVNDLDGLKKENGNSPAGQRVIDLMERPAYLLATILITNNFINIFIIILSNFVLGKIISRQVIGAWFQGETVGPFLTSSVVGTIDVLFNVVLVTFLLVLFGEVSPKVYAKIHNLKLAKFMSRPLKLFRRVFYPLSYLLVRSSTLIEKRLATRSGRKRTADEIDQAIGLTLSSEQGTEREADILRSIVKFNNIAVKQIMKARVDVQAINFDMEFKDLVKQTRKMGFSRLPVFDEEFDNVTGVLYVKDLLQHLDKGNHFEWQELIRTDIMFVPESKKIKEMLADFQDRRQHMAIVVDEFGGTSGIITLEDVVEEVIGEIRDESDVEREIEFTKINNYTYIFEGKTMLNDISKLLDVDLGIFDEVRGNTDTIAGIVLEMAGAFPPKGKKMKFKNYTFTVEKSNPRRIEKVRLELPK